MQLKSRIQAGCFRKKPVYSPNQSDDAAAFLYFGGGLPIVSSESGCESGLAIPEDVLPWQYTCVQHEND